ncbi:HesB/YadR/YfhF family protein [Lederbergia citrea]|uniref:HesB/YadR/YfhF family protein n=1 Tax=Lederbergia citrea TaxID=2833581 RepID=UPI001BC954B0|nr:HesB/YadR/YfhF family protein [Lederbergia citrea]MBS4203483.1 HesB/YadR/YfhF family protein [Lederbergia citrea]
MQIQITDRAAKWFQTEMLLQEGDYIRFYVRYGGASPIQAGFSLGVYKEEPFDIGVLHKQNGINYFIEERDLWYFNGHNLFVDYDDQSDGPLYDYKK